MDRLTFPKIGLRNIKTALAVFICLVLFYIFKRNPVYAGIAAIVSMQATLENSISMGIDRLIGTAIGGAIGILFILTKLIFYNVWIYFILIAIGIVIVIYLNVFIKKPGSVAISCVVFLIIMINAEIMEYRTVLDSLIYAMNRIVDTAIGVAIGVLVNLIARRRRYVAEEITAESEPEGVSEIETEEAEPEDEVSHSSSKPS